MKFTESERLQQLSNEYILGGVNSPSRSYKSSRWWGTSSNERRSWCLPI